MTDRPETLAESWMLGLPIFACLATIMILAHREFFSSSHRTAASAAIIAARRQQDRQP